MPEDIGTQAQGSESSPRGFSPIMTQEEFDNAIKGRLSRAEKTFEAKYKDVFDKARAFEEMEEKSKSDLQKAQEKATALQTELDQLKARDQVAAWRKKASQETGVPEELLRGDTEEDITAHAKSLQTYFEKKSGYVGSDGFAPTPSDTKSPAELFAQVVQRAL